MKYIESLVSLLCLCILSSCQSRVSRLINDAFESGFDEGCSTIEMLVAECNASTSTEDLANIGMAATIFGIETDNYQLGAKGYDLAQQAMNRDIDVCNEIYEDENYFEDQQLDYQTAMQALQLSLADMVLSDKAAGTWQTMYNQYLWNEEQNITETLTLNPDNTFVESLSINVRSNDGDYIVKAVAESSVEGKWTIESGVLTLRYKASTIRTGIKPDTFKLEATSSTLFSGDFVSNAFSTFFSQGAIKKELEKNIYEAVDQLYQQSEPSYDISFEDEEMLLRTYTQTLSYVRL